MRKKCPICSEQYFNYEELLTLTPQPLQFSPASLDCPCCKEKLGSTVFSKFMCGFILVFSLIGGMLGLAVLFPDLSKIGITVYALTTMVLNYRVIWPSIIRLKKWETIEDLLPRSRLIRYTLFLILPILFIMLLFTLAIYFG